MAVLGSATSQISYTASKGGVLAMSRELGVQFAREGIRVNALCPGPINTPLLQELFAKDPERAARRMVHIPMGRFGEADEIAGAVAFLASDDASFITASTFLVDGGSAAPTSPRCNRAGIGFAAMAKSGSTPIEFSAKALSHRRIVRLARWRSSTVISALDRPQADLLILAVFWIVISFLCLRAWLAKR